MKKNHRRIMIICLIVLASIVSIYLLNTLVNFKQESKDPEDTEDNSVTEADEDVLSVLIDLDEYPEPEQWSYPIYRKDVLVKGIYVTANTAGIADKFNNLLQLADTTELNAFVIDVKNDSGRVTFDMNVPLVDEIGAEEQAIRNIDVVMDQLYAHGIYPIARIVVFKDPYCSSRLTDYAIKNKDGSLFVYKKVSWLNPYAEESWNYVIDIAKEAARVGFKEIQFDYIRFEATKSLENADFGVEDSGEARMDVITRFIDFAKSELEAYDVKISADVFGTIMNSKIDANTIGQNYIEMAKRLDIICPMVYPSHYGRGYFGLPSSEPPDLHPYEIIYGSMKLSEEQLMNITEPDQKPIVRPWLQAFTASYLPGGEYMTYDHEAIREQVQATMDAGLNEWLLWNAGNRYGEGLNIE